MGAESGYRPGKMETVKIENVLGNYNLGQVVRIERSDGCLEEGWVITGVTQFEGATYIVVEKLNDAGQLLKKKVTSEELDAAAQRSSDSKSPERSVNERQFEVGDVVTVRRSTGEIDDGWVVLNVETDNIRVAKDSNQGTLTKNIPPYELQELNP